MKKLNLARLVPKNIFTKSGNKIYPLHVAYSRERILISNTKDRHYGFYTKSYIKVPKGRICIWYSWPAGRNQHQNKNTGKRYKYLILPQYIPLDKLTLNALGLLEAEMTKYSKRISNIIFSNSEPILNNTIINFFRRFNIQPKNWSWDITFNFKLRNKENSAETKKRERIALKFWLENTYIHFNKKQNKFIKYTGNRNYVTMKKDTIRLGSLRIIHSDVLLYQTILQILEKIKQILLRNPEYIRFYLQGIFAGDGNVKPTSYGSLDSLRIGVVDNEGKIFYSKILKRLEINSAIEKNGISFSNQKNFIRAFKYRLLELHPIRNYLFLKCLLNFKQIPADLKKEFLDLKESFNKELINSKIIIRKYKGVYDDKYKMV